MQRPFQRIAIVNRGEPAMRLIAAVRELNVARAEPLRTIALFTEADRDALFVREADEAHELGPALWTDPADGNRKSAYLDYARLRRALVATRAEAAWVGWGFVAEHAAFVELCDELGVVFIGPSAEAMRKVGDKITSKRIAEAADVPVAPWSGGPVDTLEDARRHARELGYPLMVKATAGGGGRGIRRVASEAELPAAFESARTEARLGFGDPTVFLERMVLGARHVEVQMLGDGRGTTWGIGVRDCTVQRRNQKVIEEGPSPVLDAEQDATLRAAAARLGDRVGYAGAGTVEFLYEPERRRFSFMEVNARLQVEHPVTELTTGLDLVKLQLHVAAGGRLEGQPPPTRGHAIEVRVTAEAPERDFAPAPGRITRFRLPTGPGVRVDAGFAEGDAVPSEFDSMIAKVMAVGADREEALARLRRALADTVLVLEGGASNKGFLLTLVDHPDVRSNRVDVGWLERLVATGEHVSREHAEIALVEAAVQAFVEEEARERARFYAGAARGVPAVAREPGLRVELGYEGTPYAPLVRRLGPSLFRVEIDGHALDVTRTAVGDAGHRVACGARAWRTITGRQGADRVVEVDGIPHRVTVEGGGYVRALAPGVIVSVAVGEGDRVEAGDRIVAVEAMKSETSIVAPFGGRVKAVLVTPNVQVGAGDPLVQLEPEADAAATNTRHGGRLDFASVACLVAERPPLRLHDTLSSLLLGFDADAAELDRALADHGSLSPGVAPGDPALFASERALLTVFTDVASLFRREPDGDDEEAVSSDTEYLNLFARNPDGRGQELPVVFLERLRRALRHYGLDSLDPTPELREALFRLYRSREHQHAQVTSLLGVLQRWLDDHDALAPGVDADLRDLLNAFVAATEGRFRPLNDLAREVRYRFFERPVLEQVRRAAFDAVEAELARLPALPREERGPGIATLVECTQSLRTFLSRRLRGASPALEEVLREVLVRRNYRRHALEEPGHVEHDGVGFFGARLAHEGRRHWVLACHVPLDAVPAALAAARGVIGAAPPDHDVALDVFTWSDAPIGADGGGDDRAERLRRSLEEAAFAPLPARVCVVLAGPSGRPGEELRSTHFTFRPGPAGFVEDRRMRGLHPTMAERLHLWRLERFDIERLPTVDDLYVFRAVARDNRKDERLFAFGEVRDLTAVRDEAGRVVSLPHVERTLLDALAAIRLEQSRRTDRTRLHWNRVTLFFWPVLDLRRDDLGRLAHALGPATRGLGLERVEILARIPAPKGPPVERRLVITNSGGHGLHLRFTDPPARPLEPLTPYVQKVVSLRRRGLMYPYALLEMVTPRDGAQSDFPPGEFVEHDLDEAGTRLVPVDRPPGENRANVVVGVIRHFTDKHPEGMPRVALLGDPSASMGSLAEPECRRIIAAIDLAEELRVPLEWVAVSGGAKIAMESGTENMDWIALVLRRIVTFTQAGGEIDVIVAGINVGAQPYWNAEATMLMHTRGVLIQTAQGAMVLTGKRALDYSGGVSAEDDFGIGGFDRIMGPNGQAQYFAKDLGAAYHVLLRHYEHTYVAAGERFPRRATTSDPIDRDVRHFPHGSEGFATVGDVFGDASNRARKKPFDIRRVMRAVTDQDHEPLVRWRAMRDAEVAHVWDAHVGGVPVCLLGLESRPLPRLGFVPGDGPDKWTAGTLFPLSSKKIARALNSASGNRPAVVLANLSGFDGSPESMRNLQLEYGAEIGRAVVNFDGPIVFCVVSRYHGGAFVVFSNKLNDHMEVVALEGAHASVIGGAPAAAVVFAREVDDRTAQDPRVRSLEDELRQATGADKVRLRARLVTVTAAVRSEKLGEVAEEFDTVHSVHRAKEVGSVHRILPVAELRPYLVAALERGVRSLAGSIPPMRL